VPGFYNGIAWTGRGAYQLDLQLDPAKFIPCPLAVSIPNIFDALWIGAPRLLIQCGLGILYRGADRRRRRGPVEILRYE